MIYVPFRKLKKGKIKKPKKLLLLMSSGAVRTYAEYVEPHLLLTLTQKNSIIQFIFALFRILYLFPGRRHIFCVPFKRTGSKFAFNYRRPPNY